MESAVRERKQKDLNEYRKNWEINAKIDSLWSVLSLPGKFGQGWDEEQFFSIGNNEIEEVFRFMSANEIQLRAHSRCLDFGCGVGRITEALALRFEESVGIDISESMIKQAQARVTRGQKKNIKYVLSMSPDLEAALGSESFDLVYTNIVLQHLNNDLQREYIRQFAKILKPGGLAVFQIPTVKPSFKFARSAIKTLTAVRPKNFISLMKRSMTQGVWPWQIRIEMNVLTEVEVELTAKERGLSLLKTGYIDWDTLYADHRFVLMDTPKGREGGYTPSPLYFFRKN